MPLAPGPVTLSADEVTEPLGQAISKGHSSVRIGSPEKRACRPRTPLPHDPKRPEVDGPLEGQRFAATSDRS